MRRTHPRPNHAPEGGRPLNERDEFYAEVGRRVRMAREAAGLTQDALADQVELSRTSVTNIEKGRQKNRASHALQSRVGRRR